MPPHSGNPIPCLESHPHLEPHPIWNPTLDFNPIPVRNPTFSAPLHNLWLVPHHSLSGTTPLSGTPSPVWNPIIIWNPTPSGTPPLTGTPPSAPPQHLVPSTLTAPSDKQCLLLICSLLPHLPHAELFPPSQPPLAPPPVTAIWPSCPCQSHLLPSHSPNPDCTCSHLAPCHSLLPPPPMPSGPPAPTPPHLSPPYPLCPPHPSNITTKGSLHPKRYFSKFPNFLIWEYRVGNNANITNFVYLWKTRLDVYEVWCKWVPKDDQQLNHMLHHFLWTLEHADIQNDTGQVHLTVSCSVNWAKSLFGCGCESLRPL